MFAWQSQGLQAPALVLEATEEYFEEQDLFGDFLSATCVAEAAASAPVQTLYALWVQWCNARGAQAGWVGALRAQFSRRGYSVKRDQTRSDRATVVVGMRLSDEAQLLGVL